MVAAAAQHSGPASSGRCTPPSAPGSTSRAAARTRRRSRRPGRVGLPASLAAAAESDELDQLIKDSHNEAFDQVGIDVGTPVIRIAGNTIFGPVITPAPRGEAAGRLYDGVALVTATDGFFELKRSRDRKPSFD